MTVTLFAAPLASAAPVSLVVCTGEQTTSFNPGLTFTPRSVHFSTTASPISCTGSDVEEGAESGGYTVEGTPTLSCGAINKSIEVTQTYHWEDGSTSTVVLNASVNAKPLGTTVLQQYGEVTDGRYAGLQVQQVIVTVTDLSELLGCLTTGVTSANGYITLTLTA
ncbi:hypothetical protein [Streptomyces virginiae]|uniref:hypothetical protein n=1 Tax=Streptomyces virginiae TaxID=1961 RepID=UPI0033177E7A